MYPAEFDYRRPNTVDDAVSLLTDHADEQVEVLAGGHSLLPMMKSGLARPDLLVDIGRIDELRGIAASDDAITIGATTTYATVLESELLANEAPALVDAVAEVGDLQVRNRGTLGGNIANADPAADPPAAFLAADGTAVVRGLDGERRVDAEALFLGMYTTSLEDDELLVGLEIPTSEERVVGSYAKRESPSSGYAVVGIAVSLTVDDRTVETARVAATGIEDFPVRLESVEEVLVDAPLTAEAIDDAAARAIDDLDVDFLMDDKDATPEFRAQLVKIYTERALNDALAQA